MTDRSTTRWPDWQPIETAPKGGTEIDVWYYCHDEKWWPNKCGISNGSRTANVKWQDGCWREWSDKWCKWIPVANEHYTVSHWLPVPEPPTTEKTK